MFLMALINVTTPAGTFGVEGDDRGVTRISMPSERRRATPGVAPSPVQQLARQIERYASGGRVDYSLELLVWPAVSPFTRAVWEALPEIPRGDVRTYGDVAIMIDRPHAARAVGNALNQNPFALVIPCHRVVAANGIGGYGGGVEVKRALLALEGVTY
jgi:methylated-DNA-[protein]-cysteine S-methyltransferase